MVASCQRQAVLQLANEGQIPQQQATVYKGQGLPRYNLHMVYPMSVIFIVVIEDLPGSFSH